jgi:hypothetical protein
VKQDWKEMSAKPQWKTKLDILENFISSNPEIYIDKNEISIPEHLRDKFYVYFDEIRNTFVTNFFSSMPLDVDTLCNNYMYAEKEVMDCLKIDRVDLPVDLKSFLHNPREGMVRWLYNRLFEMIQKKITMEEFEKIAEIDLVSTTAAMYRLGYEIWAALTIVMLLEPDKSFSVELDDNFEPVAGELKEIAFGRQFNHSTKRIPEFIIHSKKLNCYITVKMPIAREVISYYPPHEIPQKMMRDRTGDTSYMLDNRIMFLSIIKDLNSIPVYAEVNERKIKSPDIIIDFLTEQDLNDTDRITQIQYRLQIMQPRYGGNIVIMNPGEKPASFALESNLTLFMAGFDKTKLLPVIDKLLV